MNIILCGLPMSGKTTIGRQLAKKLNWDFIDTDLMIEDAYLMRTGRQQTCPQIYAAEGDEYFRELEREQVTLLKSSASNIIALGGGTLGKPDNVKVLQLVGDLFYLKTPTKIIWERMQKSSLPAYLDKENLENDFYTIAEKRIPLYEQTATYIIETENLNEEGIVDAIINQRKEKDGE